MENNEVNVTGGGKIEYITDVKRDKPEYNKYAYTNRLDTTIETVEPNGLEPIPDCPEDLIPGESAEPEMPIKPRNID